MQSFGVSSLRSLSKRSRDVNAGAMSQITIPTASRMTLIHPWTKGRRANLDIDLSIPPFRTASVTVTLTAGDFWDQEAASVNQCPWDVLTVKRAVGRNPAQAIEG